jgi:hypothetical protein
MLELADKIRFLLDTYNLYGDEGTFTFPDGDTWHKDRSEEAVPCRR